MTLLLDYFFFLFLNFGSHLCPQFMQELTSLLLPENPVNTPINMKNSIIIGPPIAKPMMIPSMVSRHPPENAVPTLYPLCPPTICVEPHFSQRTASLRSIGSPLVWLLELDTRFPCELDVLRWLLDVLTV